MLGAILTILAGIALILVLVLCTPLRVRVRVDTAQKPPLDINLFLLGGVVPLPAIRPSGDKKAKDPPVDKKEKPKRGSPIRISDMTKAGPKLIANLLKQIKIQELEAKIGFGFRDPADTGMTYGLIWPILYGVSSLEKVALSLQPDFEQTRFEGRGRLAVRVTPVKLLIPMVGFGWTVFAAPRFARHFQ